MLKHTHSLDFIAISQLLSSILPITN